MEWNSAAGCGVCGGHFIQEEINTLLYYALPLIRNLYANIKTYSVRGWEAIESIETHSQQNHYTIQAAFQYMVTGMLLSQQCFIVYIPNKFSIHWLDFGDWQPVRGVLDPAKLRDKFMFSSAHN